ncbi:STAS domain-containing protein [Leptospira interrogans]|uniref:Anti-sigma factor antagonist n=4 Tax=Leptospira interrogans TaxID=173 RepID=Q8EXS2_LEPIN|nr:STAS domain-containing protein [Leptospira interrogans]APH43338.1 STAS domain protein [Leptospira interrogans serovar Copenhageni/Icterohaemorrhagiae]OCC29583.1 Anti-anti-sigma factor [Leptospira interrogans serovar Canicola]AAN51695.1 anti-sigma factor antagonist [Leptospira interrogans serovar Lai str. 56601]AAS72137.1 anti-sigma factor antagonist [Leptospira interrogans serovar Copenhageni str. Fiocruz L1-130]AER04353.1 anti-sigma factor antagonist [Leptospira interrogans serovar Lai str
METTNNSKDELSVEIISNSHVNHLLKPHMTIVKTSGEVNIFSSKKLKDLFNSKIDEGARVLLLDLSATTHIDSSGLAVLISTQAKLMKQLKGALIVYAIPSPINKIFELTRLDKLITMSIDLDEALDKAMTF